MEYQIELFEGTAGALFQRAYAVRIEVFVVEQHVPEALERDEDDDRATHVLAGDPRDPARALGTARLVEKPGGKGKIGRVAVRREFRTLGIGLAMMRALEAHARRRGLKELVLESQVTAIPFYERLGYVAEGETYLDVGIDHRLMRKPLQP